MKKTIKQELYGLFIEFWQAPNHKKFWISVGYVSLIVLFILHPYVFCGIQIIGTMILIANALDGDPDDLAILWVFSLLTYVGLAVFILSLLLYFLCAPPIKFIYRNIIKFNIFLNKNQRINEQGH